MIPLARLLPELPSVALTPAEAAVCAAVAWTCPLPAAWNGAAGAGRGCWTNEGDLLGPGHPGKTPRFFAPLVVLG